MSLRFYERCGACSDRAELTCAQCSGSGKVRPQWPRERVWKEIDDRRLEIARLQREIDSLDFNSNIDGVDHPWIRHAIAFTSSRSIEEEIKELEAML